MPDKYTKLPTTVDSSDDDASGQQSRGASRSETPSPPPMRRVIAASPNSASQLVSSLRNGAAVAAAVERAPLMETFERNAAAIGSSIAQPYHKRRPTAQDTLATASVLGLSALAADASGPESGMEANNDKIDMRGKGKDKAGVIEHGNDLAINIRFGEGQDLLIHVGGEDFIWRVKEKIKEARTGLESKYLRLIHAGKILSDDKTMIESLPKNLFVQYEQPPANTSSLGGSGEKKSRSSMSIEDVLVSMLTSGNATTVSSSGEGSVGSSHGSMLPTHMIRPNNNSNSSSIQHPLDSISIDIPGNSKGSNGLSTTEVPSPQKTIPIQAGPIYLLCSLSDHAPTAGPMSATKKGKQVAGSSSSSLAPPSTLGTTSGTRREPASTLRPNRTRARPPRSPRIGVVTGGSGGAGSSTLSSVGREGSHEEEDALVTADEAEEEDDEEEADDDDDDSRLMQPRATGFDRLREAGFSEEEVQTIRRQFHASRRAMASTDGVQANGIDAEGLEEGEDALAHSRRLEEEWIDQHGAETLPDGLEGSYGEMVWGLILGFFMGLITLFWFKEATFSRRQQMGIIAGMMINVGFGILHLYY